MTLYLAISAAWFISAVASCMIAHDKGRSPLGWGVLGLIFGPISILVIAAVGRDHSVPLKEPQEPGTGARLLIDLGPLLVFFVVNAWFGIIEATGAFMVAIAAAMLVSKLKYRHISPLLWFSGVMVLVLGGITIWLHDETFIKLKPTIYYSVVAALLLFGMATGRNLLKMVLGSAYPGLSDRGWRLLTRNWALFFIAMAFVNEIVWRNTSTDFWVGFKLWGALPATFIFALANIPMLMRNGMTLDKKEAEPPVPPVQ